MHNDQRRVQSALLPFLKGLTTSDAPDAVRDCTVLNRALIQGPDPLFLAEVCPDELSQLCRAIGLHPNEGLDAIRRAHAQGPGALLVGRGVTVEDLSAGSSRRARVLPLSWKKELLWLYLASMSDTAEEGYRKDVSLLDRFRRVAGAVAKFATHMDRLADESYEAEPNRVAATALQLFQGRTEFTPDANGIPVCGEDAGFYVAYKAGHKVAGVKHGDLVFYGTTPDTTLEAQGVQVDVNISPSYGYVRLGTP